jgi:hypothetical protein
MASNEMARDGMAKAAAPAPASAGAMARAEAMPQRIGTGHGQREWAPTTQTTFERASTRPAQITQLRYDDADALVAMGVIPPPYAPYAPYARTAPRAFPQGFVADPPRW